MDRAPSNAAQLERAIASYRTGDMAAALGLCDRVLATDPNDPTALHLSGMIAVSDPAAAARGIALLRRAANLSPKDAGIWNNFANALFQSGEREEAISASRRAAEIDPNLASAHYNLANMLRAAGRRAEAIEAYRRALAISPNGPDIAGNAAVAYAEEDQPDQAIAILRAAVSAHPRRADLWNNLGNALKDIARLDDAIAAFRRSLEISPTPRVQSNLIYAMHFDPAATPAHIDLELRAFQRCYVDGMPRVALPESQRRDRRIRVGFVSSEFRAHVVGRFILPLFIHHDRDKFELFGYSDSSADDAVTALFRESAEHWKSIAHLDDAQAAKAIAADEIDLLFDLQLHMARNRMLLLARKPAKKMATYCGYPGSTGLSAMDFRVTDPVLDPPASTAPTIEKPIYLPHTYWCYDPDAVGYVGPNQTIWSDLSVNELPARSNGYLTFGCLNNFCKLNRPMLVLWAKAMRAAKDSRLILMAPQGSARQWVLQELESFGIAGDRVRFVGRQARIDYFRTYHAIDIALDTLPANGHTTSLDAMWMGVPVITRVGGAAMGRATWSQLLNVDLTAFAADTDEQFVEIAGQLAGELNGLSDLRKNLRQRMLISPITNAEAFTRAFENLCLQMSGVAASGDHT